MSKLINPTAQHYIATEADRFPDAPTKDGSAADRESATMTRNEDIGSATDSAAADSSGRKTGISLWKGILNKIPAVATIESLLTAVRDRLPSTLSGGKLQVDVTFPASQPVTFPSAQAVSVNNFPASFEVSGAVGVNNFPTSFNVGNFPSSFGVSNFPAVQAVSLASQPLPTGASSEATLSNLLNANTLNNPQTQEIPYTFTIADSTTITNYAKLRGRVATIFIPSSVAGTLLTVLQRRVDGSGSGFLIKTHEAIARTIVLSGDQTVDAESVGWLCGAIGSEIAFVSDSPQTTNQTIYVKILV